MKTYIAVAVLILIIGLSFAFKKKAEPIPIAENTPASVVTPEPENRDEALKNVPQIQFFTPIKEQKLSGKLCFADFSLSTSNDNTYHLDQMSTMHVRIQDTQVTATSTSSVGDGWVTTYVGAAGPINQTTISRVLNLWGVSTSDGVTNNKEKIDFTLTSNKISTDDKSGDGPFITSVKAVDCDELDEWIGLDTYLRQNKIYADYMVLDYKRNTGQMALPNITYSEPNPNKRVKQELKNFSYSMDSEYHVLDFKMK